MVRRWGSIPRLAFVSVPTVGMLGLSVEQVSAGVQFPSDTPFKEVILFIHHHIDCNHEGCIETLPCYGYPGTITQCRRCGKTFPHEMPGNYVPEAKSWICDAKSWDMR